MGWGAGGQLWNNCVSPDLCCGGSALFKSCGVCSFHRTFLSRLPQIMTCLPRIMFPDAVARFGATQTCYFYSSLLDFKVLLQW